MIDLLIVGGGPAGAIAGLVASRAGARVRIVDRARFPREKLCGDTINPGSLAHLRQLGVAAEIEARGAPVRGMVVTGEGGIRIDGRYPRGLTGCAILRRDLDWILLRAAIEAGCELDEGTIVRRPLMTAGPTGSRVDGIVVHGRDGEQAIHAPVVLGADGRGSRLAFGLRLARHPRHPRRWAVGGYFTGVDHQARDVGEMHIRRDCYIGVAPVPGGLTNACFVASIGARTARDWRNPAGLLGAALARDALLRDRFAHATLVAPPVVLGPLAVDVAVPHIDGLLLAGDASGFIDPMTGDGLRFAFRGGELAAHAALRALEHGWGGIHEALASERAARFAPKWRFNRALRALVSSPRGVAAAGMAARLAPAALRAIVAHAGDCHVSV